MKKKLKNEEVPENYDETSLSKSEEAFGKLLKFIKEKSIQDALKEVKK